MHKMISNTPARKVAASSLAAAITTLIVWVIGILVPETVLPEGVPNAIQGALLTVVVFVVGYYTPPAEGDQIEAVEPANQVAGQ